MGRVRTIDNCLELYRILLLLEVSCSATRCFRLKTKIDAPPRDTDEQTIPKSLERVIKLKEAVRSGKISVKTKKRKRRSKNGLITLGPQNKSLHPSAKPEKSVPVFDQRPGESTESFMHRVNRETHQFLNETTFEKKYNVEIKRNPETGDVEGVSKAPKDEIDELMKLKMKHKNIGKKKKKKATEVEPKLTKVQKRKRKLDMKKEKKMQDSIDEFKVFREKVEFGDVAHAPPNLKLRPIKSKDGQPGERRLLLHSLFPNTAKTDSTKAKSVPIDMTGRRRDLPSAERRILEKQQSDVIAAYRLLKTTQKMSNVA